MAWNHRVVTRKKSNCIWEISRELHPRDRTSRHLWLKVGPGCEVDHSNAISMKKIKVKQHPKQQKPGGQKETLTKERKEDEEILCGFVKGKVLILKCELPAGHQVGSWKEWQIWSLEKYRWCGRACVACRCVTSQGKADHWDVSLTSETLFQIMY